MSAFNILGVFIPKGEIEQFATQYLLDAQQFCSNCDAPAGKCQDKKSCEGDFVDQKDSTRVEYKLKSYVSLGDAGVAGVAGDAPKKTSLVGRVKKAIGAGCCEIKMGEDGFHVRQVDEYDRNSVFFVVEERQMDEGGVSSVSLSELQELVTEYGKAVAGTALEKLELSWCTYRAH